jgi:hypothetical protein
MPWTDRERRCEDCKQPFLATGSRQVKCPGCQILHRRARSAVTGRDQCACGALKWKDSAKCNACSRASDHYQNNRTPELDPVEEPTALDIAWVAGFYEGEGSCIFAAGSVRVQIPQKDPESIERIQRWFGGRVGPNGSCSVLVLYGPRAMRLIKSVYPYLTARRRQQVDEAISRRWPNGQVP